jgi:hypothetical protein
VIQVAGAIEFSRRLLDAKVGVLILGNKVNTLAHEIVRQRFSDVLIYDVDALAFLVAKHASLVNQFESIIREALAFSEPLQIQPKEVDLEKDLSAPRWSPIISVIIERPLRGGDLCNEIKSIGAGRTHAKKFEQKVTEALQYIFEEDLTSWTPQKSSDTQISFYDLVARVNSEHDFWNTIVNQFRSRYIVFEFKNYGAAIRQTQIYTTEKYLFVAALRSTAIIISKKGADRNALAACRGALRENGKLIINLNVDDLCRMLHLKDQGDDHNAVLVEYVDKMLMALER